MPVRGLHAALLERRLGLTFLGADRVIEQAVAAHERPLLSKTELRLVGPLLAGSALWLVVDW